MKAHWKPLFFLITCVAMTGWACAAQPAAKADATLTAARPPAGMTPVAPGLLKGFGAAVKTVVAGQPLTFNLEGSGPCRVKLNTGDGYVKEFSGVLPFGAAYTYGTGSMSSFDVSKEYTATVAPAGSCKIVGVLAPVKVSVMNPAPQSAGQSGGSGSQSLVTSTVNLKLKP